MDLSEVSREDIVKKFDLPERQTKINTIFKMQNEGPPLYCICKSADIDSFMIMCEKCEEWYHGDCIGMQQKDSQSIKKWFCFDCVEEYTLKIVYKNPKNSVKPKKKKEHKQKWFHEKDHQVTQNSRCGQCSNCLQNEECGNKNINFRAKHLKYDNQKGTSTLHSHTITSKMINIDGQSSTGQIGGNSEKKRLKRGKKRLRESAQCYGPGCSKTARASSKYCSDECGLELAKQRILTILPYRIAEREQIPCVADILDRSKLVNIRLQMKISIDKLKVLDAKEVDLRRLIARAKTFPIIDSIIELQEDANMDCLTCGWEIPVRSFRRHMELCFKKLDSQFECVGPSDSSRDICKIFCDFFDATKKTYCKRLRYICPDHFKPEKVPENEVCGCPITQTISPDIFLNPEGFCQQAKVKCDIHFNWENTYLSEIDLDRLKEINKLNQLLEEEAIIKQQLTNRSGALGLLLHSTSISE